MGDEAFKLLAKAIASKAGWHRKELDSLYEAFGFIIVHKTNHDKVYHPEHPELFTFIPRHPSQKLGVYNIDNAIKLINRLQKIKETKNV